MPAFLRPDLLKFAAYSAHPQTEGEWQPDIIDCLDTNECSYDLPPALKEKLAWHYQNAISANRYPDGAQSDLKAAIARYASTSGGLDPDAVSHHHISIGNGSDELIRSLLIATCAGRSGAILVAEPTFSMYRILAETLGIAVARVARDEQAFEMDLQAAQAAVDNSVEPIRVVFMVSPNSPTGNCLTPAEMSWLRQLPEDVLVVVDEAYFEFSQATTVKEAITRPNWVVTRTFSKAFRLAAHRVGYAIASPDIIQTLEKVRLPYNLPSFSQAAARLVLEHASEVLAIVPEVQREREQLSLHFEDLSGITVWPSEANFLYCRPTEHHADALLSDLRRQGTHIRHTGGGLRITVGTPAENARTLANLTKILKQ